MRTVSTRLKAPPVLRSDLKSFVFSAAQVEVQQFRTLVRFVHGLITFLLVFHWSLVLAIKQFFLMPRSMPRKYTYSADDVRLSLAE